MLVLDGNANTISGLAVGGLPSGVVTGTNIANNTLTGSQLAAGQILSAINMPTGSVIQTVSMSTGSVTTVTSGSSATLVTLSITPQFTSSKILIMGSLQTRVDTGGGGGDYYLYRNGSAVPSAPVVGFIANSGSLGWEGNMAMLYLDSPASTSSLTYTIWLANGSGTIRNNYSTYNSAISTLVLQEIR